MPEKGINEETNTTGFGVNHILAIAIEGYSYPLKPLDTPLADCKEIMKVLVERYESFSWEETTLQQALGRKDILDSLSQFEKKFSPKDTLWIIFSGHGTHDAAKGEGYLLPIASDFQSANTSGISNLDFLTHLNGILAGKIILIVDSCFAGALTDAIARDGQRKTKKLNAPFLIGSGGMEPVDNGKGHSPFAEALIHVLQNNKEETLQLTDLVTKLHAYMQKKGVPQDPFGKQLNCCGVDNGASKYYLSLKEEPPGDLEKHPSKMTLSELIETLFEETRCR